MKIDRSDVIWNYGATFLRVASGLIILPLIITRLPIEDVGLWGVMISLNSLIYLFDFGFFTTISRNVTYIFSGAKELSKEGLSHSNNDSQIDFSLLKGVLSASAKVYSLFAITLLILFSTLGTLYINKLLIGYGGNIVNARIAWYAYGLLLSYQFYTYYYDALLVGRGYIKRSRQIIVVSQLLHIITATTLLLSGVGILSMVIGQSLATLVNRTLAKQVFFDTDTRRSLKVSKQISWREILSKIWPSVYKSGLSGVGGVLSKNILPIIGAMFIPLSIMGYYSLTKIIIDVTFTLSLIWFTTYYPKLTANTTKFNNGEVKRIFVKGEIISFVIFLGAAVTTLLFGNSVVSFLKEGTHLLPKWLIIIYFASSFAESVTYISTQVILSSNRVPYWKSQLVTSVIVLILLVIILQITDYGVVALILVPFLIQSLYQNWRWIWVVSKEYSVRLSDYSLKNLRF